VIDNTITSRGFRMYNSILKGLIVDANLTQSQLARIIRVSNSTLSNVIAGKTKCKKAKMELIAEYFNKPVKSIFKEANYVSNKRKR
jgi:transcriptional regulator with XRE-family HTH domain